MSSKTGRRLALAVALSATAHGGLLAWSSSAGTLRPALPAIQISLVAPAAPGPRAALRPAPAPTAQPAATATPTDRPAPSTADDAATARARVEARIRADFARHFEYPTVARRMGWGGEVLLAFRVEPDGNLDSIRVARSSGYAVLDQSAVEALAKVPPLAEQRAATARRSYDLQLAVSYRLED